MALYRLPLLSSASLLSLASLVLLVVACGDDEVSSETLRDSEGASIVGQCSATSRSCLPPEACTGSTCLPGSCLSDADCPAVDSTSSSVHGGGSVGGPSLQADELITVTHDSAVDSVLTAIHLTGRRMNTLRDLDEDDHPFEWAREAVGGASGEANCDVSGTVRIDAVSETLDDPFSEAPRLFEGEAYTFDDCVWRAAAVPNFPDSDAFDGRAMWLVAADDEHVRYTASEDGIQLAADSDGQIAISRRQASSWALFTVPVFETTGSSRYYGEWSSSRHMTIATEESAAAFNLLPLDEPWAVLERGSFEGGDTGVIVRMNARIEIDQIDTERDDCTGPGAFEIRGERVVVTDEGPAAGREGMVYEITGAGGATATVRPNYEFLGDPDNPASREDGFMVIIDGVEEVYDSSTATARRDNLRDTCLPDFPEIGI